MISLSRNRACATTARPRGAQCLHPCARVSRPAARTPIHMRGWGKDAVEGWLDLAKLVSSEGSSSKSPYHDLAVNIGRDIYVDVAGWHLFMRDMNAVPGLKMSEALATQLGPKGALRESDVSDLLKQIPVKLGAGKTKVSLYEVMPSFCVSDLTKLLEEFARR